MTVRRGRLASLVLSLSILACGSRTAPVVDDPDAGPPCTPRGPERCDGADDDCDGRVDEAIAPVECGPAACPTTVRCEDGVMPACVPRTPAPESCNLEDDDCDGRVDEGLGFGPLGDVITLRSDEGDTGACSTCRWAFNAFLAPLDDGLMAVWNLGLYGGREQPNLYGRRLDRRGRPVGPVELIRDDFVLSMRPVTALAPYPPLGLPIEVYYRVGTSDVFGLLFVDPAGGTHVERPLTPSGPRNREVMAWTGERLVAVWEGADTLLMATYAPDGTDERRVEVPDVPLGAFPGAIGVYPDRVGVVVPVVRDGGDHREMWLVVVDRAGRLTSARALDVAYQSWQRLVGVPDGWLYVSPNAFGEPSTWQLLAVDGTARTPPRPFDDGRSLSDSGGADVFVPRPAQRETLLVWQSSSGTPDDAMHVEIFDEAMNVTRAWSGALPPDEAAYLGDPHVAFVDDRIVVVWHAGAPDAEPNPVYALELGCTP